MNDDLYLDIDCYRDEEKPDFDAAVHALREFKQGDVASVLWHFAFQRMNGRIIYLPVISTADSFDQCVLDMEEYTFSYFWGVFGRDMPSDQQMSVLCKYCVDTILTKINSNGFSIGEPLSHYTTLLMMILIGRVQSKMLINDELKTAIIPLEV